MKLQPDRSDAPAILGYGPGWIGIGRALVADADPAQIGRAHV